MSLQHSKITTFSAKMLSARLFCFVKRRFVFPGGSSWVWGTVEIGNQLQSGGSGRDTSQHDPNCFDPLDIQIYTTPKGVKKLYVWQSKSIPSQEVFGCLGRMTRDNRDILNRTSSLRLYEDIEAMTCPSPSSYKREWNIAPTISRVFHPSYPLIFGLFETRPL